MTDENIVYHSEETKEEATNNTDIIVDIELKKEILNLLLDEDEPVVNPRGDLLKLDEITEKIYDNKDKLSFKEVMYIVDLIIIPREITDDQYLVDKNLKK